MVRDTVLPNGLTVIVAENHAVPLATVKVSFRGGAGMQGPGEEGLAHIAEHYLFRTYGADNQFASEVADLRGTYNGATSEGEVNYYVTLPSTNVGSAVRILAKLVREPKVAGPALEAEKKVVIDELARDESDATSALRAEMGKQLWGSEWFRKNVGGTEQSVNAIRMDRVRSLFTTQYVPANAAVIVSGDVSADATMTEVIRRFGDWSAPAAAKAAAAPSTLETTRTFAIGPPDVALVTISVEWPGPSATVSPSEALAGEVFAEMLNSPISPAVERFLTYGPFHSLGASFDVLADQGAFSLTAVTSPDATDRGLAVMKSELERLAAPEYLNDSLLTVAKQRLRLRAEYVLESGVVLSSALGETWSAAGLDYFRNYGDAVDAMSLATVDAFVKKYLLGRPYVAGVLGPAARVSQLRADVSTALGRKTP